MGTSKATALEIRNSALEEEVKSLTAKMAILAPESASYLAIRSRFFSTYRRDILGEAKSLHRDTIPLGNQEAYGGGRLGRR